MAIAAMKKFQIVGMKKEIDLISSEIINCSNIELIDKKRENFNFKLHFSENPYKKHVDQLFEIMSTLNIKADKSKTVMLKCYTKSKDTGLLSCEDLNISKISKYIKPIQKRIKRLQELEKRLDKEEHRLKNLKHHIYLMRNMDIELDELRELSYISLIFGSINVDDYERLIENINDMSILILEVTRDEDRVWFFTFSKKDNQEKAMNILKSAYFEEIKLPLRVKGEPREILKRSEHRLERLEIIREQIKLEYKKIAHRASEQLKEYYHKLKYLNKVKEIGNNYYNEAEYLFVTSGWIIAGQENSFANRISKKYPNVIYSSELVMRDTEDKPPTVIENPVWIKPFESLVKLYGIPAYNEMDPSIFLAVSYIIMFGMMFGDLGQGFIFALLGWLIYTEKLKITKQENSYLFIGLGISSMFFGILYGSVFTLEDILPALLIRPMENIMVLLGVTVILGIVLLIITMSFNLVNSYRERDIEEGIFSRNGLSGLFFYLFTLSSVASILIRGSLLLPTGVTIVLLILPLLLIFFKEPLSSMLKGRGWKIEGNSSEYFMESFFELFDTLLGYMSNTISFVRIGAFTLNHVGLSMAVVILSEMMRNNIGSFLILLIGNLVIMGLEGLVVGIQILRLEFFELFGKFYHGDGKELDPVRIKD